MQGSHADRRLAAILIADVVGYSALMEADEQSALASWRTLWTTLVLPTLEDRSGRVVKTTGDGFIAEFRSVVDAVEAAAMIQKGPTAPAQHGRLVLRIGVNVGDVVVDGDDVYGDAVNIAARLEQMCDPGGVLISGAAYDQLVGKSPLRFTGVGRRELKNIQRSIEVYKLDRGAEPTGATHRPWTNEKPVIAVLPFENASDSSDRRYFSDGITEDIITDLSRFNEVAVVARNSSFALRDGPRDVQQTGKRLGADFVLEGSVRPIGPRVRITAQLTDVATGLQRWADRHDCAAADLYDFQEKISQSIVAAVAREVRDQTVDALKRRPIADLRAYDLVLRAHRLSDDFRPDAQRQVRELYERALELDPKLARAHSGLSYCYLNLWVDGAVGRPIANDANAKRALSLAEEAVALDPKDPRCHSTLGFTLIQHHLILRGVRHIDVARQLNSNDPTILILWAYAQSCVGNFEAGRQAVEVAQRLNPQHPPWYINFSGRLHFLAGRYEDAVSDFSVFQGLASRKLRVWGWHVAALALLGRIDEARAAFDEFHQTLSALWVMPEKPSRKDSMSWAMTVACLANEEDRSRLRRGMELIV